METIVNPDTVNLTKLSPSFVKLVLIAMAIANHESDSVADAGVAAVGSVEDALQKFEEADQRERYNILAHYAEILHAARQSIDLEGQQLLVSLMKLQGQVLPTGPVTIEGHAEETKDA